MGPPLFDDADLPDNPPYGVSLDFLSSSSSNYFFFFASSMSVFLKNSSVNEGYFL
jgi:hypothetical protein